MDILKSILGEYNRFEGLLTFTVYFLTYYCGKYYFKYDKQLKLFAIITICITSIIGILQYYNIYPVYYLYDLLDFVKNSNFEIDVKYALNFFIKDMIYLLCDITKK